MELKKYIKEDYPAKIDEFQHTLTIGEMEVDALSSIQLTAEITRIIKRWVKVNPKCEAVSNEDAIDLIIEHIFDKCKNLEIQEINYIFKEGVKGTFGTLYSQVGIDTITGIDGWIENYYKLYRIKRSEPKRLEIEIKLNGNEMTSEQYFAKYPEEKAKRELLEIFTKAKQGLVTFEDAKKFYKIKGLTGDDYKDDMQIYSHNYFAAHQDMGYSENSYCLEQHRKFILNNFLKNKA